MEIAGPSRSSRRPARDARLRFLVTTGSHGRSSVVTDSGERRPRSSPVRASRSGLPGTLRSADTTVTPSSPTHARRAANDAAFASSSEAHRTARRTRRRAGPARVPSAATTTASTLCAQRGPERAGRRGRRSPAVRGPRGPPGRCTELGRSRAESRGPDHDAVGADEGLRGSHDRHRGSRDDLDRDAIRERRGHSAPRGSADRARADARPRAVSRWNTFERSVHAARDEDRLPDGAPEGRRAGCRRPRTAACTSSRPRPRRRATTSERRDRPPADASARAGQAVRIGDRPHQLDLGLQTDPAWDSTRDRTCSISGQTSEAEAPGSATMKFECFSETRAPPTRRPFAPPPRSAGRRGRRRGS